MHRLSGGERAEYYPSNRPFNNIPSQYRKTPRAFKSKETNYTSRKHSEIAIGDSNFDNIREPYDNTTRINDYRRKATFSYQKSNYDRFSNENSVKERQSYGYYDSGKVYKESSIKRRDSTTASSAAVSPINTPYDLKEDKLTLLDHQKSNFSNHYFGDSRSSLQSKADTNYSSSGSNTTVATSKGDTITLNLNAKSYVRKNSDNVIRRDSYNKFNLLPPIGSNTEILKIKIKLEKSEKELNLCRYDNISNSLRLFSDANDIEDRFLKPIETTINQGMTRIFQLINHRMEPSDKEILDRCLDLSEDSLNITSISSISFVDDESDSNFSKLNKSY